MIKINRKKRTKLDTENDRITLSKKRIRTIKKNKKRNNNKEMIQKSRNRIVILPSFLFV